MFSVAQRVGLLLTLLKNNSKGWPEFTTTAGVVRGRKEHFQAFAFFLNTLIYDSWGGNVPFGGKKKGEERVTEGEYLKLSPVCPYHSHKSQVSHQFKM